MNRVGEVYDLPQKIRAGSKALDDAWHLRTPGTRAPIIVGGKRFARGVGIFNDVNLGWRRRLPLYAGRNHGFGRYRF